MDFLPKRSFDPKKDKLSELPIYDQLDWLLIFFNAPNNRKGISILDAAYFIKGFSSHTEAEIVESISDELIENTKSLIEQLLEDKYIKGHPPFDVDNNATKIYKPTYKAFLTDTQIGGYRRDIYEQKSEERTIDYIRRREDDFRVSSNRSNIILIFIFIITALFSGISAYIANKTYSLELLRRSENSQAKEAQLKIILQDSLLQGKDKMLHCQKIQMDSLRQAYDSLKNSK